MSLKYLLILPLGLLLIHCGRVGKLDSGKYEVADQEYSSQNYTMRRLFQPEGRFQEQHVVDRCLLMEMNGHWLQDGKTLILTYAQVRNRPSCRDSLPDFARDSSQLKIPVRKVESGAFESLLAAADGKPEKWIRWNKVE
jgi:hypothetical protein